MYMFVSRSEPKDRSEPRQRSSSFAEGANVDPHDV